MDALTLKNLSGLKLTDPLGLGRVEKIEPEKLVAVTSRHWCDFIAEQHPLRAHTEQV